MPTESEFDQYNRPIEQPEIKSDPDPANRLRGLDPQGCGCERPVVCWRCTPIRATLLWGLAAYGVYSLIF